MTINGDRTPRREWGLRLCVGLSSLLFAVLLIEVGVRTVEAPTIRQNEFVFYEYDEVLGWRNKAGSEGSFTIPDTTSYVRINSQGLRDREHNYRKPPGTFRIAFLGDSCTWGYGVNADERYVDVFARKIQQQTTRAVEVINLGTTGYGTDQEHLLLLKEGIKYQPDVVVLAYHNDLGEVWSSVAYSYPKPKFILQRDRSDTLVLTNVPVPRRNLEWSERFEVADRRRPLLGRLHAAVMRHLHSYRLLINRIDAIRAPTGAMDSTSKPAIDWDGTMQIIDRLLLKTKQDVEANGGTFVLLLIPDEHQVYRAGETREIDTVLAIAKQHDIPAVNLLPELQRIARQDPDLYFKIDTHFSVHGNTVVGNLVAAAFGRLGIPNQPATVPD